MLFVTSTSQATRHAVYAIERNPPLTIQAAGATVAAIVEQFPWGPDGLYTIQGIRDFIDTYAPAGASRTGPGYMSVIGKAWPVLKVCRVLGTGAAAASVTLTTGGGSPTNLLTLNLKYKGSLGNSVTAQVTSATDGDSNHFNLLVTLTTATGTTTDKFENLNYSGTGADSTPSFTNTKLLGGITKIAAGIPASSTTSFTGGADGTVTSASYVGTQGAADHGISLFESDKNVDLIMTGDPGNSLRAAVNAGLAAHADYTTDRIAFINGDSGMTASAAQADVTSYRSFRVCYIDCWAYQADDVDGTQHLVPPAAFAMSTAANLSPSTSFSWKSVTAQRYMSSIVSLETSRGDAAYQNELAGICTLQREDKGGYTFECAVVTAAPENPAKRKYKRTRMAHYIAKAVVAALREYIDSPNVDFNQQDEVNGVHDFLDGLKRNAKRDPNSLPHIVDFSIRTLSDFNSQSDIDNGEFTIPADVKISSDQEKVFFSLQIGETVQVATTL